MRLRLSFLALAPACAACQLIDPGSALTSGVASDAGGGADAGCGANSFCDDFQRDVAIPSGDTLWSKVACDPGASLGVSQGSLNVTYPANGGQSFETCFLDSSPTSVSVGHFDLDFDLQYGTSSDVDPKTYISVAQVLVSLGSTPNALGIENISFQLLIDPSGEGQLLAIPYYPNANQSPMKGQNYPPFELGSLYLPNGPWLEPNTDCHISVSVDTTVPSGTASATCSGAPTALGPGGTGIPAGISAPASLSLGYGYPAEGTPVPGWQLTYRRLVFEWSPD
jgi:hypothetical protein